MRLYPDGGSHHCDDLFFSWCACTVTCEIILWPERLKVHLGLQCYVVAYWGGGENT